MRREVIFFLLIGTWNFLLEGRNQPYNPFSSSYLDSVITFILKQDYQKANQGLIEYLKIFPNDLKANYFLFATEQTRLLDYESYSIEYKNFKTFCNNIKDKLENEIGKLEGSDSILCLFYLANISGGMSVVEAKSGNWLEGVKNGLYSFSLLNKVKERDSSFVAADLGIGIFNYYLTTTVKKIPFVKADENSGIEAIKRALNSDFPFNYAAKNSLCWILIDKEDFKTVDSLAQSVLDLYPENTIFLRIKAHAALWSGDYSKALPLGKKMIDLAEKRNPINWSDFVAGYMILLSSEEKLSKRGELCNDAVKFMMLNIPEEYIEIPHIKKNIKTIKNICKDICKKKLR